MSTALRYSATTGATFYATLRQRVDAYFESRQLSRHANGRIWAKTSFFLASFVVLYGRFV
ncbi:hypothetical protein [Hymenobacter psychrophilus]|uniref:Linoleoyl-CoA desaturase n=1 Tax=Hymenobacter psychrophilus TaxID=651662 RepID=A0A1H3L5J3_9BACT|nr:hypothetical protein [Hymenobacter psychrophilus]SDY59683.1 linoleoyl-CoA desaturase [Hymenobacter psychrophilus]